jgi:hypothetical protein
MSLVVRYTLCALLVAAAVAAWVGVGGELRPAAEMTRGLGLVLATAAATIAAFPARNLARAWRGSRWRTDVCRGDLERALHVAMFAGTVVLAAGAAAAVVSLMPGLGALMRRPERLPAALGWALLAPAYAVVLRMLVIEPLKASLRSRLLQLRQS